MRRVKLVRKCPWRGPSSTHYWLLYCDIRRRYPHDKGQGVWGLWTREKGSQLRSEAGWR